MKLEIVAPDAFATAAADRFIAAATDAIAARGRFVVALTGGTTPIGMHRALVTRALDWTRCTIAFGDDRLVPDDDPRNNARAAREALLDHVRGARVLPMRMPALGGPARRFARRAERAAAAYARALEAECGGALDLLIVGLGGDAHVLSLFPGCAFLQERVRLCVPILDPPMNPAVSRLTLTPVAIERARSVLALAAGAGKKAAVTAALAEGEPGPVPARILRRSANVTLLVDREAAP